jgi:toxin ParE1/3/4
MKMRYAPRAVQDLDDIRRYIEKDNPKAAWVVASFIKRSIAVLEDWPYHGRATEKENVRRLVVMNYPYVVFYRVDDEVIILSVRHQARNRD